MNWLELADTGLVRPERIVAVGPADAAGMARLLRVTPQDRIVVLTGGRKRRSVLVLDSGHVVVTALTVEEIRDWAARAGGQE